MFERGNVSTLQRWKRRKGAEEKRSRGEKGKRGRGEEGKRGRGEEGKRGRGEKGKRGGRPKCPSPFLLYSFSPFLFCRGKIYV
jgi:hypothetical protein